MLRRLRGALVFAACGVALVAAVSGSSAQSALQTRSCSQAGSFFNVQIAGNVDATYWGRIHADLFAAIPRGEAMVAVWSFGSQRNKRPDLYGWATESRSRIAERCRARSARRPSEGALRPSIRVEDGWAFGRRYECHRRGRVVIQTRALRGGTQIAVWMEKSRELIAIGEISGRSGWVRASKRCDERKL
jgi:hypothetical protein